MNKRNRRAKKAYKEKQRQADSRDPGKLRTIAEQFQLHLTIGETNYPELDPEQQQAYRRVFYAGASHMYKMMEGIGNETPQGAMKCFDVLEAEQHAFWIDELAKDDIAAMTKNKPSAQA